MSAPCSFASRAISSAAVAEAERRMRLDTSLLQQQLVLVRALLVLSRLEVVAFFPQHAGRGALHHVDQQVPGGAAT
ncbi:hypothetical protein ACQ86N_13760 [Puia sp. P3]|uniref:hypothetical protein n=1 Tax=Puia sp. P3 TaxID=3423952 RepID=UPI003D67D6BB